MLQYENKDSLRPQSFRPGSKPLRLCSFGGASISFGKGLLLFLSVWAFVCVVLLSLPSAEARAASSLAQLEKDLAREKSNAEERRKSLQRMTEEERKLNARLAAAEKRILELERGIAQQQTKLQELGSADDKARIEYENLLMEQAKTEQAQTEALRLLWEITGKRIAVGGREIAGWAEADRDYTWSQELYKSLESYRKKLDEQETKLSQVLGRRDKISRDMQHRLQSVNDEKAKLLKTRLDYDKQIAELRKKRGSAEAELKDILKLVENLNFEITQRSGGKITTMKGRLPWPVTGKVRKRYSPQADPPSQGLSIATSEGAEVKAVAGGKVVHNDILRGFGTVVIVQHGEDYYSLYAFLASSSLQAGQDVSGDQVIGRAGVYPAISGPGLYFELRFKQKAINPEPWLVSGK